MKSFVLRRLKKTSAIRRTLAMFMVIALSFTMLSVDALAAKKVAKKAATKINVSSKKLYVGQTLTLKLTNGKKTIKATKATTGAKSIATVSLNKKNGTAKVTAKKARKAAVVITLYNKKKAYKCRVTVINTKINKTAVTITEGKTYQLKLTGTGIKSVKTSNKKIATVNSKGLVKGVKAGSVTVTLTGKNNVKHNCKVTVKAKIVKITGVKLSTTTPKIGETINATLEPKGANNAKSYQWYRTTSADELMIKGETKATYTVGAGDVNCSLYCVVTDNAGKKFYSKETSKVQASIITETTISGLSTKSVSTAKTPDLAVIGDKLTAEVTPKSAANLVTYQWYRGSSAITGATNSEYTLVDADWQNDISVEITAVDSSAVSFKTATAKKASLENKVVKNINTTTGKLSSTAIVQGNTIGVTVKDGETTLNTTEHYDVKWYQDTVNTDNLLSSADSYEVEPSDIGHTIVAEITAKNPTTKYYAGSFTLSTGKAAGSLSAMEVKLIGEGATYGVGTVLTAELGKTVNEVWKKDDQATATYAFYRDGVLIQNGASKTYTLTTDDKKNVSQEYKVIATGTGSYSGTVTSGPVNATVAATSSIEGFKVYVGDTQLFDEETNDEYNRKEAVAIGDTLTVKAVAGIGTAALHANWYKSDGDSSLDNGYILIAEDTLSYTIPSDFNTNDKLSVVAYYTGDGSDSLIPTNNATKIATNPIGTSGGPTGLSAYTTLGGEGENNWFIPKYAATSATAQGPVTGNGASAMVYDFVVSKALTEATVSYDNSLTKNSAMTGYKTYTGPEVGAFAHVAVKPSGTTPTTQWYVDKVDDDYKIVAADAEGHQVANGVTAGTNGAYNSLNLRITDSMIGHKLICKLTGGTGYTGSEIVTEASSKVAVSSKTIAKIKVIDNTSTPTINSKTTYDSATQATTLVAGKQYKVYALDSEGNVITSGVKYQWDGTKSTSYLIDSPEDGDAAQTWTAVAGKGIISVTVTPDGKNYTGNAVNYTFSTELNGDSSSTGAFNISIAPSTGSIVVVNGQQTVNNANTQVLTATVNAGIDNIESKQWYSRSSSTGAWEAVTTGDTNYTTSAITTSSSPAAGKQYKIVITDAEGNKYDSSSADNGATTGVITMATPIATYFRDGSTFATSDDITAGQITFATVNDSKTAALAKTSANGDIYAFDQFGTTVSNSTISPDSGVAGTYGSNGTVTAANGVAFTVDSGKVKIGAKNTTSGLSNEHSPYTFQFGGIAWTVTVTSAS